MNPGRWWTYQRERFPVIGHGVLILVFSASAVGFSMVLRGAVGLPSLPVLAAAFATSFLAFLHLRIADEFKDFEEDSRFRPYRPVPRGLVTLRELGWVAVGGAVLQVAIAVALDPRLLGVLGVIWLYMAMMAREFFCRDWLKRRPVIYMVSHMFVMPLIDLYATACDWLVHVGRPPNGLWWFVLVSFLNGFVIEIGRKIRSPGDEEEGVETYSVLWGRRRAVGAWLAAIGLTFVAAICAAQRIDFVPQTAGTLGVAFIVAGAIAVRFLGRPASGKPFEIVAGLWTLALYVVLGVVPVMVRAF
jgi:4-hydroxybenzoate polyprenyltransferase